MVIAIKRKVVKICSFVLLVAFLVVGMMTYSANNIAEVYADDIRTNVMDDYINNHTPSGWTRIGGVKSVTFQGQNEMWQLIRTSNTIQNYYNLAEYIISYETYLQCKGKASFSLATGETLAYTTIRGNIFNIGGGASLSTPIWNAYEAEITLNYGQEVISRSTYEQARSVSFTVEIQSYGTWALQQVINQYNYRLMKFRLVEVYKDVEDGRDKKGNVTGYHQELDYKYWRYDSDVTYSTNESDFFRISKIA